MKLYKKMRDGENLSWCRPYRCDDKYYVRNEGEIVSIMDNGVDLVIDKDTLRIVEECDEWEEIGCAECPWRDECDAMDDDGSSWNDDELAEIVRNANDWTDPDCEDAMRILCESGGLKLAEMCRNGEDCSEIFERLHASVPSEFMDGTPDYSEDEEDYTDWLYHGAEQAEPVHLCYALEQILDIDLGL